MSTKKPLIQKESNKEPQRSLNVRMSASDYEQMQKLADKYAGGNLSLFVRHASLNFKPSSK